MCKHPKFCCYGNPQELSFPAGVRPIAKRLFLKEAGDVSFLTNGCAPSHVHLEFQPQEALTLICYVRIEL
jgi:hypothetical protein